MSSERDKDVNRRRKGRKLGREVIIPPCEDLPRRLALEADDEQWLQWYCPQLFWYAFTEQQKEMIAAIRRAIQEGGDQAIAASRGEGKSKISERLLLKYTLQGAIKFSVLFAATGTAAQDSLQSIQYEVETNDRLAADYPEVCAAVRALENTPNRAHYQLVTGIRHDSHEPYKRVSSKFSWCGKELVLPNVPGAPAAGGIIATRGLDSAVRGLSKRDRRPDVAILDDPDNEDSANSEELAGKLEKRIDRAIVGLGGQRRTVARVMLTTLQNRVCASYKFTDPQQKPSWKGRRFRFLVSPPTNPSLWDEYVSLRRADWREETNHAHVFYMEHRADMDEGAIVANPNRFTPSQESALQFYFDQIARTDAAAVQSEYDNDPPEEAGPVESGIHPRLVQTQVSGFERGVIPPGCVALTQGVDVGKHRLHWVVRAWRPDETGFTIDYGTDDVLDVKHGSDEGLDRAIHRAVLRRMDLFKDAGYCTAGGEQVRDPLTLVDARYRTDAIYDACAKIGPGIYPVMGIGTSAGCVLGHYRDVLRRTADKQPGDGWHREQKGRVWLVSIDADRWKAFEHDRWMTAADRPGCMFLFGEPSDIPDRLSPDQRMHGTFSEHICAEVEGEEEYKGVIRRRWRVKSRENHWFDAAVYADVAANMKGVKALATRPADQPRRSAVISMGRPPYSPRW